MIEITPMQNRETAQTLLAAAGVQTEAAEVLDMQEGGKSLGQAIVSVEGDTVFLHQMEVDGFQKEQAPDMMQAFVLDSLLRAGVSYGEHHGARKVETCFPDFFQFFEKHGFETDETHAYGPVSLIISYG